MDEDDYVIAACSPVIIGLLTKENRRRRNKKIWVKKWLAARDDKGAYNNIIQELRLDDVGSYRRYLRMNTETFEELLLNISPKLEKQRTMMRKPLSVAEKLACTLRYLATGESFSSLQFQFRISKSTISLFIPEVCEAIYESLKDKYLKFPSTEEEWLKISDDIYKHWQFPNSIGCMDGKHIAVSFPPKNGSSFYNYKKFFSVVLLALVKHNYQFLYVNVGCQGRLSDGGVFKNTDLYHGIMSNTLSLPKPRPLPKTGDPSWDEDDYQNLPFLIVGDDAFQLSSHMIKPYSGRTLTNEKIVFNYRLSRFRRCSENAFGIWVARFRVFLSRIYIRNLVTVNKIILAGEVLHSMLCEKISFLLYTPPPPIFCRSRRCFYRHCIKWSMER